MARSRPTRAQQARLNLAFGVFLVGLALAWSFGAGLAAVFSGLGWHPALPYLRTPLISVTGSPVGIHAPAVNVWAWRVCTFLLAIPVGALVWLLMRPQPDQRTRGLGQWPQVRKLLSARAVRKAAKFTRPDLNRRARRKAPLTELGYRVGTMRGTRHPMWASFEIRCRIIARTGWGKTSRFLVQAARGLPGAALIGSTSPDLFEQTVRARQARGSVMVVDFSESTHRYAEGFDRVHWDPLRGCEDWQLALRRARALVAGAEDGNRNDEKDGFFRDSATDVIAAWFHAAVLDGKDIREVVRWQRNIELTDAKDIIDRHPAGQKAARLALEKHLDPKAPRTTSSVERFVLLAMAPFATVEGEEFALGVPVDIAELIEQRATVYLLASPTTAAGVAPLLTMFADEWFHTARQVAIRSGGNRRLPVPAVGVLDELRTLVPIPSLPQVCYEMRKYGIGVIYSVQNQGQEVELYHDEALSLAQNVQLTILGGYDEGLVDELVAQAGPIDVTSPTASGGAMSIPTISDGTQWRDVISPADLQELGDGQAVMRVAGVRPFFGSFRSFRDSRRLRYVIAREERQVRGQVAAAQAAAASRQSSWLATARADYAGRGQ